MSDLLFAYHAQSTNSSAVFYASSAFLVLPFVINLAVLARVLIRESKRTEFAQYFVANSVRLTL